MNKKLKIAYIVESFPAISETFIVNQIIDMIDRGHAVHVYATWESSPPYHKMVNDYGLKKKTIYCKNPQNILELFHQIISVLFISPKFFTGVIKYLFEEKVVNNKSLSSPLFSLANKLLKKKYDIIHAHYGMTGQYMALLKKWGGLKGTKLVTTFHGYDIHSPNLKEHQYETLINYGDLFTVNSKYSEKLVLNLGFSKNKIEILPVGLNFNYFVPRPKKHDLFSILFIGRLISFKAPGLVIEICKNLIKKGISLQCRIIGEGDLYSELEQKITDYGIRENVLLLGKRTQEEITDLMNLSDVFLLPGVYDDTGRAENQGLVIQEAQAMQLPVLISNVGGMSEGIIDNKTGYVIEEKNIDSFVEKIEYLYKNPNKGKEMGKVGMEFVKKNYDVRILGNQLEMLYYLSN